MADSSINLFGATVTGAALGAVGSSAFLWSHAIGIRNPIGLSIISSSSLLSALAFYNAGSYYNKVTAGAYADPIRECIRDRSQRAALVEHNQASEVSR